MKKRIFSLISAILLSVLAINFISCSSDKTTATTQTVDTTTLSVTLTSSVDDVTVSGSVASLDPMERNVRASYIQIADETGIVVFENVELGRYRLTVTNEEHFHTYENDDFQVRSTNIVIESSVILFDISEPLPTLHMVNISLSTSDNKSVLGAKTYLTHRQNPTFSYTRTAQNVLVTIDQVISGEYTFMVELPGYMPIITDICVEDSDIDISVILEEVIPAGVYFNTEEDSNIEFRGKDWTFIYHDIITDSYTITNGTYIKSGINVTLITEVGEDYTGVIYVREIDSDIYLEISDFIQPLHINGIYIKN